MRRGCFIMGRIRLWSRGRAAEFRSTTASSPRAQVPVQDRGRHPGPRTLVLDSRASYSLKMTTHSTSLTSTSSSRSRSGIRAAAINSERAVGQIHETSMLARFGGRRSSDQSRDAPHDEARRAGRIWERHSFPRCRASPARGSGELRARQRQASSDSRRRFAREMATRNTRLQRVAPEGCVDN